VSKLNQDIDNFTQAWIDISADYIDEDEFNQVLRMEK
jgi:hypothetical protein